MRSLVLLLCLLSAGCISAVADTTLVLDEPIVLVAETPVVPQDDAGEPTPKVETVTPKTQPPPAVPVKPNYRWTYPGDLGSHLRSVHGVDILGMSRNEMLQKHDALHNAELANKQAAPAQNIVVQYTIDSCSWCKYDQKNIFPQWGAQGWKFQIVNETASPKGVYPRYEIRWAGGKVKQHTGSLTTWKN
jgi:hypothetical protein